MSLIDDANNIGLRLAESTEYIEFKNAEIRYLNNQEVQNRVLEYRNLFKELAKNNTDVNLRERIDGQYNELLKYEDFNKYIETKKNFDALLNNVHSLIDFHLDIEKKSQCPKKGKCGGCK